MSCIYSIYAEQITLVFKLVKGTSFRKYHCNLPFSVIENIEDSVSQTQTISLDIPNSVTCLHITTFGKTDQDTLLENGEIVRDQTLSIEQAFVNGIKIEPWALAKMAYYIPDYTPSQKHWALEHGVELSKTTNELCFYTNGTWYWNLQQPFFVEYNKILFEHFGYVNEWVREWHLGISQQQDVDKLQMLLEKASER